MGPVGSASGRLDGRFWQPLPRWLPNGEGMMGWARSRSILMCSVMCCSSKSWINPLIGLERAAHHNSAGGSYATVDADVVTLLHAERVNRKCVLSKLSREKNGVRDFPKKVLCRVYVVCRVFLAMANHPHRKHAVPLKRALKHRRPVRVNVTLEQRVHNLGKYLARQRGLTFSMWLATMIAQAEIDAFKSAPKA